MSVIATQIGSPVQLRNGKLAYIRPVRPDDVFRLQSLFAALSPSSVFNRFLSYRKEFSHAEAEYFACVDFETRAGLVATLGDGGQEQIIGLASYDQLPPINEGIAEAAVLVQDEFQGLGVGTELLYGLAALARQHGVGVFVGTIHCENDQMLRWLEKAKAHVHFSRSADDCEISIRVHLLPD